MRPSTGRARTAKLLQPFTTDLLPHSPDKRFHLELFFVAGKRLQFVLGTFPGFCKEPFPGSTEKLFRESLWQIPQIRFDWEPTKDPLFDSPPCCYFTGSLWVT